jgi:hypothetical protein
MSSEGYIAYPVGNKFELAGTCGSLLQTTVQWLFGVLQIKIKKNMPVSHYNLQQAAPTNQITQQFAEGRGP